MGKESGESIGIWFDLSVVVTITFVLRLTDLVVIALVNFAVVDFKVGITTTGVLLKGAGAPFVATNGFIDDFNVVLNVLVVGVHEVFVLLTLFVNIAEIVELLVTVDKLAGVALSCNIVE